MSDDYTGTDEIGKEVAAMLRVMLQLAILVATRTRTRGQRDAEARAKAARIMEKEAREQQLREARDAKRIDPRNKALLREISKSRMVARDNTARTRTPAVSLVKVREPMHWDSNERRQHLAEHVSRVAPTKEIADIRMLHDIGQAKPASAIAAERLHKEAAERTAHQRGREMDARGIERTRQ